MNARLTTCVYLHAKEAVLELGYDEEIQWQELRSNTDPSESEILREAAWVILSAGISVKAVQSVFPGVSSAYWNWCLDALLASDLEIVERCALRRFAHPAKIRAITAFSLNLRQIGHETLLQAVRRDGPNYLSNFDYLGPATSQHLAKNLGLQVAKPDRHLTRISARLGWGNPQEMCEVVAALTGDTVAVVDIVLWRFAASDPTYLEKIDESVRSWIPETKCPCG